MTEGDGGGMLGAAPVGGLNESARVEDINTNLYNGLSNPGDGLASSLLGRSELR